MGNKPTKAEKQAANEAYERDIVAKQARREREEEERLAALERKRYVELI